MISKFLLTLLVLNNLFSVSYASGSVEQSIEIAIVDEYYPSTPEANYRGSSPHARGVIVGYTIDEIEKRDWNDVYVPFYSINLTLKIEKDSEIYDSDRLPVSGYVDLNFLVPVANFDERISLNLVSGANVLYNGPQINDQEYIVHGGVNIETKTATSIGIFKAGVSAELAGYYYEVDDEPALDHTNSPREVLNHKGKGPLLTASISYEVGKNRFSVNVSQLSGSDKAQGMGDYTHTKKSINWDHALSKNVKCGIEVSSDRHKYQPIVLNMKDNLIATKASCNYRF